MKKLLALLLASIMVISLAACGQKDTPQNDSQGTNGEEENKPITLTLSDLNAETGHTGIFCKHFKETIEAAGVNITIDYYPNGTLTGQDIEAVAAGLCDIMQCTPSTAAGIWAPMAAMDAPYIYTDVDEAMAVVRPGSAWMEYANENMRASNVMMVGMFYAGTRETTTTSKPIYSLDDMKGLKLRVVNGDLYIKLFRAFGCEPTPMAFSEVPTALVTGVCEGQENPYSAIVSSNLYEIQDYVIETHHMPANYGFYMNAASWDKLSSAQQEVLLDAMYETGCWNSAWIAEDLDKNRQICVDNSMTIITEADGLDLASFEQAAMGIYDDYADEWGDAVSIIKSCYEG